MDLIDRDELFESIFFIENDDGFLETVISKEDIINAKVFDAVPVVKCKDCIYCSEPIGSKLDGNLIFYCNHDDGLCGFIMENFYCCLGMKKGIENE